MVVHCVFRLGPRSWVFLSVGRGGVIKAKAAKGALKRGVRYTQISGNFRTGRIDQFTVRLADFRIGQFGRRPNTTPRARAASKKKESPWPVVIAVAIFLIIIGAAIG